MKKWGIYGLIGAVVVGVLIYFFNYYPNVSREDNNLDTIYSSEGKVLAKKDQKRFHAGVGAQTIVVGADNEYQFCFNANPFYSKINIPKQLTVKETTEDLLESLGPTVLSPYEVNGGFRYLGGREANILLDYNLTTKQSKLITTFDIIGSTEVIWSPDKKHALLNGFDQNGNAGNWLVGVDNKSIKKIDYAKAQFLNNTEIIGITDGKIIKQSINSQSSTLIDNLEPLGFVADNDRIAYWTSKQLSVVVSEKKKVYKIDNIDKATFGEEYLLFSNDKAAKLLKLGDPGVATFTFKASLISIYQKGFIVNSPNGTWFINPTGQTAQKFSNQSIFDPLFGSEKKIIGIENDILHTITFNE